MRRTASPFGFLPLSTHCGSCAWLCTLISCLSSAVNQSKGETLVSCRIIETGKVEVCVLNHRVFSMVPSLVEWVECIFGCSFTALFRPKLGLLKLPWAERVSMCFTALGLNGRHRRSSCYSADCPLIGQSETQPLSWGAIIPFRGRWFMSNHVKCSRQSHSCGLAPQCAESSSYLNPWGASRWKDGMADCSTHFNAGFQIMHHIEPLCQTLTPSWKPLYFFKYKYKPFI